MGDGASLQAESSKLICRQAVAGMDASFVAGRNFQTASVGVKNVAANDDKAGQGRMQRPSANTSARIIASIIVPRLRNCDHQWRSGIKACWGPKLALQRKAARAHAPKPGDSRDACDCAAAFGSACACAALETRGRKAPMTE